MKRFIIILMLTAALISNVAFASPQTDCIDRLAPYADQVNDAGLYPSVYIAQGMLETGWCKSPATQYNNYWGIKCRGGTCFSKTTWEVYDGSQWTGSLMFQSFSTLSDGTAAYIYKITENPIYADVDRSTLDAYIFTLARHWATDPDYARKLWVIIEDYGLVQYDRRE